MMINYIHFHFPNFVIRHFIYPIIISINFNYQIISRHLFKQIRFLLFYQILFQIMFFFFNYKIDYFIYFQTNYYFLGYLMINLLIIFFIVLFYLQLNQEYIFPHHFIIQYLIRFSNMLTINWSCFLSMSHLYFYFFPKIKHLPNSPQNTFPFFYFTIRFTKLLHNFK